MSKEERKRPCWAKRVIVLWNALEKVGQGVENARGRAQAKWESQVNKVLVTLFHTKEASIFGVYLSSECIGTIR